MATRKVHHVETEQAAEVACGQPVRGRTRTLNSSEVTCPDCEQALNQATEATEPRPAATTKPPATEGTLKGDALIARKRLAGAGRSQESGTAFGSKWTQAERDELQKLYDEHGRAKGVATFLEAHPHRTRHGCLYQLERHLTKAAKATEAAG